MIIGGLIPILIFGVDVYFKETLEVQLHDSYFIFRPFEFALSTIGPMLFLTFLFDGLNTKFKKRMTWLFFGLGTVIIGLIAIEIYELFKMPRI
jgi:hypothetical protein